MPPSRSGQWPFGSCRSTSVGGGENSGSTLEHTSVVRDLIAIGKTKRSDANAQIEWAIPMNKEWKSENVKFVVFVQEDSTLKVLAVKQIGR